MFPRDTNTLEQASYDYVVGADGAHSLVRQLCGIDMAGTRNLQSIANVHFTSQALSEAARENPAMLYFVVRTRSAFQRRRSGAYGSL
jgi:2-polyprenyl-6-methoxyphenol hydroxylase-like FAD-dependent oxidoreductase